MDPENIPQRRSSTARSLNYVLKRFILRRPFLTAHLPELDLQFRVKTEDVVGRHIFKYHVHEPLLSAFLLRHLRLAPGDVVIDIGANIGWYSMLLQRTAPAGVDIFSFEPDPLNFELLTDNIALNGARQVEAVQQALAAEAGVQKLYRHDSNNLGRHSLLPLRDGAAIEVPTTTLDGFWEQRGLGTRCPRFIKIDVEGYELFALRGGDRVLSHCPELLCEFSPEYMRAGGVDPADLVDLLTGHGFRPHRIDSDGLAPADPAALADVDGVIDLFWRKEPVG